MATAHRARVQEPLVFMVGMVRFAVQAFKYQLNALIEDLFSRH
jgi:hypothetical protein